MWTRYRSLRPLAGRSRLMGQGDFGAQRSVALDQRGRKQFGNGLLEGAPVNPVAFLVIAQAQWKARSKPPARSAPGQRIGVRWSNGVCAWLV